MHTANALAVQRKVVVRTKSGSCTENKSSPANVTHPRRLFRQVRLETQPAHSPVGSC
jgi:hypothetical protein